MTEPDPDSYPRPRRQRLIDAVACGLVVAVYVAISYSVRLAPSEANDFTMHWTAARALLEGENPYLTMRARPVYPFGGLYYYPLPAALLVAPVAWLPAKVAATIFLACGATLLAYHVAATERWRLAMLLSAPMLSTAAAGQNTAFVTTAALVPSLGWLVAAKPNVGLAILAMRPSKAAIVGALAFGLVGFAFVPTWPFDWLQSVADDPGFHVAPVLAPGGFVLLLAASRWRRPEARLLLALSCVPHTMTWYDALPLMLIPSTLRQLLVLGILSHLASFVAASMTLRWEGPPLFEATAPVAVWGLYVPALVLVMRRPNQGNVPRWIERVTAAWPSWLRGTPPPSGVPGQEVPAPARLS